MSLLLSEKLAISSIFPLQKGGSRTPSNSKYLLSNSIGVLGVSASLSAILETSRQRKDKRTRTATRTAWYRNQRQWRWRWWWWRWRWWCFETPLPLASWWWSSKWSCMASGQVDLQPIMRERSDVMRAHESQHQDHSHRARGRALPQRKDAPVKLP